MCYNYSNNYRPAYECIFITCIQGTLEEHHIQFMHRLGSLTYSNDKRKSLKCITFLMYNYSIHQGTSHEVVKHHAINLHKMNGWRTQNHSVESELSTFIYVTGPAKMDQVGTQNLTTFFTFVAS